MKSLYISLGDLIYNTAQFPDLYGITINETFNLKNLSNTVNFDNINYLYQRNSFRLQYTKTLKLTSPSIEKPF
jgi:hypothetical protein